MTGLKELFKKNSKAAATTATENGWSADGMYWYENGVKPRINTGVVLLS